MGHLDPCQPEFSGQVARFAANPIFKGIRVGGGPFADIEKDGFIGDMETLLSHNLQLDVLLGAEQLDGVAQLARQLPELRVVINHVAHVPIDGQAPDARWSDAMARVAQHPRVYCKASALVEMSTVQPAPSDPGFYVPTLDALWQAFGEDRLVYGSNWPVSDRAGQYRTVIGIVRDYFEAKGETAAAKYWHRNAAVAYGL